MPDGRTREERLEDLVAVLHADATRSGALLGLKRREDWDLLREVLATVKARTR